MGQGGGNFASHQGRCISGPPVLGSSTLRIVALVTFPGGAPEHQGRKRTCRRPVTCPPEMNPQGRRMEGQGRRESRRMIKVPRDG